MVGMHFLGKSTGKRTVPMPAYWLFIARVHTLA